MLRAISQDDVGKTIWNRGKELKGTVTRVSFRYCAACGTHPCYMVSWEDGTKTKPCTAGVGCVGDDLIIL